MLSASYVKLPDFFGTHVNFLVSGYKYMIDSDSSLEKVTWSYFIFRDLEKPKSRPITSISRSRHVKSNAIYEGQVLIHLKIPGPLLHPSRGAGEGRCPYLHYLKKKNKHLV